MFYETPDQRVTGTILYENTSHKGAFDYFAGKLLTYARSGEGEHGNPDESPTYGRQKEVTLPDGRKFTIMDANRLGEPIDKAAWLVDIRPDEEQQIAGVRNGRADGMFMFWGGGDKRLGRHITVQDSQTPEGVKGSIKTINEIIKAVSSPTTPAKLF